MNAKQVLHYIEQQQKAIQDLIAQLDEIQVAFNAQFDQFKVRHDATLDRLTDQVFDHMPALGPELRTAIEKQTKVERQQIDERRLKIEKDYLPQRQKAADDLLQEAQTELAQLRKFNPALDRQEEKLKAQKAELEAQLASLNEEIRRQSRGLGVVFHFMAILNTDRERQRTIGKLEALRDSLGKVRTRWETLRTKTEAHQAELQQKWQLESIAVARLQSELDQLTDEADRANLARRRAIRHVLDDLKLPSPGTDPELDAGLGEMIELNVQTDDYHEGLASVGGVIGLARGVSSGLQAIGQSIDGLLQEWQMHSQYLKPLDFSLPARVEAFHRQWPALTRQFSDEKAIGSHPADFSAAVKPLLARELSQASIEAMFDDLSTMIKAATAQW
jgi:predicted  nucleic acid-binding Zn-ribbon protein